MNVPTVKLACFFVFLSLLSGVSHAGNVIDRRQPLEVASLSEFPTAPTNILPTELIEAGTKLPEYFSINGYIALQVWIEFRSPVNSWER